jgi:tRNA-dihydrouridine synthase B
VKAALSIPVVANGDISSAHQAREVLTHTRADALMIGRAAQGRPWIFREIAHFLAHGSLPPPPTVREVQGWLTEHLHDHYALYGEHTGMRTARKHIGWAVRSVPGGMAFRDHMNTLQTCTEQLRALEGFFESLAECHAHWPEADRTGVNPEDADAAQWSAAKAAANDAARCVPSALARAA